MKPEISIIVPFFNRIQLLQKTILSVLDQTFHNWELILVDDGSDEDITPFLSGLEQNKIKLYKREKGLKGAPTCRNIGAEKSNSDLILFLDSDDLIAPWALEKRLNFITEHPGLGLYVFEGLEFDNSHPHENRLRTIRNIEDPLKGFLNFQSVWQTSCVVWKKEMFQSIGGWDENVNSWQDGEIHIRFLLTGIPYIWGGDLPDVFIRKHEDVNRISNSENIEKYINLYQTYMKVAAMLEVNKPLKSEFENNINNILFTFVEGFDKKLLADYRNWVRQKKLSATLKIQLIFYINLFKTFNNSEISYKIIYQLRKIGLPNKRKLFWSIQPTLDRNKRLELLQLLKNDTLFQHEIAFLKSQHKI